MMLVIITFMLIALPIAIICSASDGHTRMFNGLCCICGGKLDVLSGSSCSACNKERVRRYGK